MNSLTDSNTKEQPITSLKTEALRLENVSVRYMLQQERVSTFKEYAIRWVQGKIKNVGFWALHNFTLTAYRGEVLGLIGRNGAGKSTLLKVLARVMRPTIGRVVVYGRVAPLLEVGAGFHGELTGRENIFLNGAMLGFSHHQILEKFDRIVEFAELGSFIDAPMRTYSSGMWARLGFAVATDVKPDILIVDEVLSVGDEAFQRKSLARIQEIREQGATILMVSHNMVAVQDMCHRVAWINQGELKKLGPPDEVIAAYRESQT